MATAQNGADASAFDTVDQAVLSADIVGYTRLMESAAHDTHRRFRSLRVELIDPTVVEFRGAIVKNTGDGFFATFDAPSDAAKCAMALQNALRTEMEDVPEGMRIEYRIGLHFGPVIRDFEDIYGHDVNLAARLQELAPAGGILCSKTFHQAAGGSHDFAVSDLGNMRLKNLVEPVPAFQIVLGEEGAVQRDNAPETESNAPSHDLRSIPSIALMPFRNDTGDPNAEHIVGGFVDDIITSLSNLRDIFTVSRGSTVAAHLANLSPERVVERLGVKYILLGNVRQSRHGWKLHVELVDGATGDVVWGSDFDLKPDDIFDVQDELTINIVRQISGQVRSAEVRRVLRKKPGSLTAYDHFLQGLDLIYRLRSQHFEQAFVQLNLATEEDPNYAAPLALMSHWHMIRAAEGWSPDPAGDTRRVVELAERAIECDPDNALAHALQGQAEAMFNRDIASGQYLVDRSRELSPNNSWAWTFSSGPYGFAGDTAAAIKQAETAVRLSPIDQHLFFKLCLLAQNHYLHGNYAEAVAFGRRSLAANPRFGNAARILIAALIAQNDHDAASKIVKHHSQIAPSFQTSEYRLRCPFQEDHAELYVDRLNKAGVQK